MSAAALVHEATCLLLHMLVPLVTNIGQWACVSHLITEHAHWLPLSTYSFPPRFSNIVRADEDRLVIHGYGSGPKRPQIGAHDRKCHETHV